MRGREAQSASFPGHDPFSVCRRCHHPYQCVHHIFGRKPCEGTLSGKHHRRVWDQVVRWNCDGVQYRRHVQHRVRRWRRRRRSPGRLHQARPRVKPGRRPATPGNSASRLDSDRRGDGGRRVGSVQWRAAVRTYRPRVGGVEARGWAGRGGLCCRHPTTASSRLGHGRVPGALPRQAQDAAAVPRQMGRPPIVEQHVGEGHASTEEVRRRLRAAGRHCQSRPCQSRPCPRRSSCRVLERVGQAEDSTDDGQGGQPVRQAPEHVRYGDGRTLHLRFRVRRIKRCRVCPTRPSRPSGGGGGGVGGAQDPAQAATRDVGGGEAAHVQQ